MLLLFLVLFSWTVEAKKLLYPQKAFVHQPSKTKGHKSIRKLFLDIPPPNISNLDPKIDHYDWSLSSDQNLEIANYNYKDPWWVTIRDFYRTKDNVFRQPDDTTKVPSVYDDNIGRINGKDLTRMGKVFIDVPENAVKGGKLYRSGKNTFKLDERDDVDGNLTEIKDSAVKRNKQIQRMQVELGPTTNETVIKPIAENMMNKLGVNLENLKQNRSLNVLYNKVVESLQFNVGEDKTAGLGGLTIEDAMKKYFGLKAQTPHTPKTIEPRWEVMSTGIPRQRAPFEPKIPPDYKNPPDGSQPDTPPGWIPPEKISPTTRFEKPPPRHTPPGWELPVTGAYERPAEDYDPHESTPPVWMPPPKPKTPDWLSGGTSPSWGANEQPTLLMTELKKEMKMNRIGYFTAFAGHLSSVISNKPDNEVRLLGLSFEREYELLTTQDKYILGFGQPFLGWFHQLANKLATLPADFIQDRASIVYGQISLRREHLPGELNTILDYIDDLYEEAEGTALLKAVELVQNYPNTTENLFEIMRNVSKAVFAPYRRLTGSTKRQILIDSVNKFISSLNPPSSTTGEPYFDSTKSILRRFSNKTRFSIVGRKSDKTKVEFKKPKARDDRYFDREEPKFRDIYDKRKITVDKRFETTKDQKKLPARSTSKYSTTQRKLKNNEDFKKKLTKILRKDIQQMIYKMQKMKVNSREFNYSKDSIFAKIDEFQKYTKLKTKMPKDKVLYNTSDFDDELSINETKYDSDYYTDELKTNNADTSRTTESVKDKKYISKTPKPMVGPKFQSTARTLKTTRQISWKNSQHDKAVSKIEPNNIKLNANKLKNKKNKATPTPYNTDKLQSKKENDFSSLRKENPESKVKPTTKYKSETKKNKITDLTSYSDEEDILKFKLSDAMRHSKEFFAPNRRSNHINKKYKKRIHESSSYSSEEIVLKSNIYKVLGFKNFSEPNEIVLKAVDEDSKKINNVKAKKMILPKFKPVNEMSSYSDEENILKEKLTQRELDS